MSVKSTNSHIVNTIEQVENTLITLSNIGLTRITKNLEVSMNEGSTNLTWSNHKPGRHNSGKYFNTIQQYVTIYEDGAYHAILHDGSIVRVFFKFKKNILTQQSLLFWPAPIKISETDVDNLGIRQAIEENICYNCNESLLKMRSPVRLDFDPSNSRDDHPETHLHIQHSDCRLSVKKPICFNTFIKFIFSNFYPDINLSFLGKLQPLNYSGYSCNNESVVSI